ncbi:hypothetical protein SDJN02_09015, partial [Cucurbita argyrosperma subsp. argyrosperma]
MEPITYQRIRRRSHGFARCRGFHLHSRRFSVSKLRAKFDWLLRILNRWRRSYSWSIKINKARRGGRSKASATASAEFPRCVDRGECRLRSFRRSNSFYAEAIADCLDFIKRSSVSSDRASSQPRVEFRDPSASA